MQNKNFFSILLFFLSSATVLLAPPKPAPKKVLTEEERFQREARRARRGARRAVASIPGGHGQLPQRPTDGAESDLDSSDSEVDADASADLVVDAGVGVGAAAPAARIFGGAPVHRPGGLPVDPWRITESYLSSEDLATVSATGRGMRQEYAARCAAGDPRVGTEWRRPRLLRTLDVDGHGFDISPDGQWIAVRHGDNAIRIFRLSDGEQILQLDGLSHYPAIKFSPCSQYLAMGFTAYNEIALIRVADGEIIHTFKGHTGPVVRIDFSPDGQRIVTGSRDNTAKVWNVQTGQLIHTLDAHPSLVGRWVRGIINAKFSPCGNFIITSGDDRTAKIWNAESGLLINTLTSTDTVFSQAEITKTGFVLSVTMGETAQVWNLETGLATYIIPGRVAEAKISSDGEFIIIKHALSPEIHLAKIFQTRTGDLVHTLNHEEIIEQIDISPCGQFVITKSSRLLKMWSVETGRLITTCEPNDASSCDAKCFSPCGRFLITGGWFCPIKVWRLGKVSMPADAPARVGAALSAIPDISGDGGGSAAGGRGCSMM